MPTGPFLYADQLIGTLRNKSASKYALCAPSLQWFQACAVEQVWLQFGLLQAVGLMTTALQWLRGDGAVH